jgi:xylulokinase
VRHANKPKAPGVKSDQADLLAGTNGALLLPARRVASTCWALEENTMSRWYLAIDLGTGGAKVAAIGLDGSVLASEFARIDMVLSPVGAAEQDPTQWWADITQALQRVVEHAIQGTTHSLDNCAGVGITGQWGSTVPVDAHGRAIGPCMTWQDDRGGPWSKKLVGGTIDIAGFGPKKVVTWLRLAGGAPAPSGADPTGHIQYLRNRQPEMYANAAAFLEPVDFVGVQLTGRIAATPASMVLSWLTDNRAGAAVAYHPDLIKLADRDPAKLPELLATGSTLGPILPALAKLLGIPAGTPVVAGIPDLHTAALGAGAIADFEGHIAISTSAWVSAPVPFKKTDVLHQMTSIPGIRSGSYLIANNHETGGATLRWLRDAVLTGDDGLGNPDLCYDAITAAASKSPVGSGGVIFAPWLKGERSPVEDRNLRASFLNIGLSTTRADLVRAVLEGVAYNALWLLEATEKFAGRELDGLRILGGGAQSDLWCQIHADVIGRPILQVSDPLNVNVRGAAWFAAISLGHLRADELGAIAPAARTFQPDRAANAMYKPLYAEFVRLAKSQKAMYKRLNARRRN